MTEQLSMLDGIVLDYVAEGKTARQISELTGLSPAEVAKKAYDLLDREIVTDTEQRRKLQVYSLEKLVEALWQRTMRNADRDDVKNLVDILDKLNTLLALNKEQDAQMYTRMHAHQLAAYMDALKGMLVAFKMIAPQLMTEEQWQQFAVDQIEQARETMTRAELEQ